MGNTMLRCLAGVCVGLAFAATAHGHQADDSKVATRRIVLDAPGHATTEGTAITARGGEPGAPWRLVDWRGREVEGAVGAFDAEGNAALPPLPAGYYRMVDARSTPPGGSAATPLSEGGKTRGKPPSERGDAPTGQGGVLRATKSPQ